MTGGSEQPEHVQDKQCPHCGLYYFNRGNSFNLHTAACDGSHPDEGTESGNPDDGGQSSSDGDKSTVMGSGELPTETLPCGHEEVQPAKYDPGTVLKCETCGNSYRITD